MRDSEKTPADDIDIHLFIGDDGYMSRKDRPMGCCETPNEPVPLLAADGARMAAAFKALGDPTRLEIFRLIAAQEEPLCVCDIVDRFTVSQPTISHHLKVLRETGLITVSRRGVWAYYAVNPRGLALLRQSLDAFSPVGLETAS